jgi:hypothetical protein
MNVCVWRTHQVSPVWGQGPKNSSEPGALEIHTASLFRRRRASAILLCPSGRIQFLSLSGDGLWEFSNCGVKKCTNSARVFPETPQSDNCENEIKYWLVTQRSLFFVLMGMETTHNDEIMSASVSVCSSTYYFQITKRTWIQFWYRVSTLNLGTVFNFDLYLLNISRTFTWSIFRTNHISPKRPVTNSIFDMKDGTRDEDQLVSETFFSVVNIQ